MKKILALSLLLTLMGCQKKTIHEVAVPCPSDSCKTVPAPTPTPVHKK